jgi:hypothetical protein
MRFEHWRGLELRVSVVEQDQGRSAFMKRAWKISEWPFGDGYQASNGLVAGLILASLVLLAGCAIRRHVQSYNARATIRCEQKHTPAECKPLPYPTCVATGEKDCQ